MNNPAIPLVYSGSTGYSTLWHPGPTTKSNNARPQHGRVNPLYVLLPKKVRAIAAYGLADTGGGMHFSAPALLAINISNYDDHGGSGESCFNPSGSSLTTR